MFLCFMYFPYQRFPASILKKIILMMPITVPSIMTLYSFIQSLLFRYKEYKKRIDLLKILGDGRPSSHLDKGKMQKLSLNDYEVLEFFPLDSFVAHLCKKSAIPLSSLGPSTPREYLQAIGAAHIILGDLCQVIGRYIESLLDNGGANENKYLCSLSPVKLGGLLISQVFYYEL